MLVTQRIRCHLICPAPSVRPASPPPPRCPSVRSAPPIRPLPNHHPFRRPSPRNPQRLPQNAVMGPEDGTMTAGAAAYAHSAPTRTRLNLPEPHTSAPVNLGACPKCCYGSRRWDDDSKIIPKMLLWVQKMGRWQQVPPRIPNPPPPPPSPSSLNPPKMPLWVQKVGR